MNIYATALLAIKVVNGRFFYKMQVAAFLAVSEAEAIGFGHKRLKEIYPISDGWTHEVATGKINDEWIHDVGQTING